MSTCETEAFHRFPFVWLFWLFVLPNQLSCISKLADRKQGQAFCGAPWHHFLCLWGKCTHPELWGPPAELPELPVTAWRHAVVAYPAVKFNSDPLESSSCPCSPSPRLTFTNSCPLCSAAVSSFMAARWNMWFLWASAACACFDYALLLLLWLGASDFRWLLAVHTALFCFVVPCWGSVLRSCTFCSELSVCMATVHSSCACARQQKCEHTAINWRKRRLESHANAIKSSFLFRAGWVCGARHSGYL